MNAGNIRFRLTLSSLLHLWRGGTRLTLAAGITILRLILLLDVSKYQGLINFIIMLQQGVDGVIVKCGQGMAQDPYFLTNFLRAKNAGMPRGSYWFYDSRVDPKVQAANWWNWIKADPGELMHFLDLEESYGGDYRGWKNWKVFLLEFMRLSRWPASKIGIYTGYFYWIANSPVVTADLNWFAQFDLWLAWYTTNPANVLIPKPWTKLILWQYGTNGVDGKTPNGERYGAESLEIDENQFNGDEEAYRHYFGLGQVSQPETPQPATGGAMITGTVKSTLNIRLGKGGVVTGEYLYANDTIEASEHDYQWLHLSKITHAGISVDVSANNWWASAGSTQQYIGWEEVTAPPTEPPVEPPADNKKPVKALMYYPDGTTEEWFPK